MTKKSLLLSVFGFACCAAAYAADAAARHYDARIEFNQGLAPAARKGPTVEAAQALAAGLPDVTINYDDSSGAVRSLSNPVGHLTGARPGVDAMTVALEYVRQNLSLLGLDETDLADYEVTDRVYSKVTGATHIYLRQRYRGLPVYNGQLHVNVNRDGRIISVNNSFLPGLARPRRDPPSPPVNLAPRRGERGRATSASSLACAPRVLGRGAGGERTSDGRSGGSPGEPIRGQAHVAARARGDGAPRLELPGPHPGPPARLRHDGGRRRRQGLDALRLGGFRLLPRLRAAGGEPEPRLARCRPPTGARSW